MNTQQQWYVGKTGNHQGLIIAEKTGENVAVCYDKKDAPLLAAAPELLSALKIAIAYIYGSKAKSGVQISSVKADLDICMSAIAKATGGAS